MGSNYKESNRELRNLEHALQKCVQEIRLELCELEYNIPICTFFVKFDRLLQFSIIFPQKVRKIRESEFFYDFFFEILIREDLAARFR